LERSRQKHQVNGFIAQELETVLPNEVSGMIMMKKSRTMVKKELILRSFSCCVKAIQEQQTLIESLTARITTLEG
jgi:hypothetical protein